MTLAAWIPAPRALLCAVLLVGPAASWLRDLIYATHLSRHRKEGTP